MERIVRRGTRDDGIPASCWSCWPFSTRALRCALLLVAGTSVLASYAIVGQSQGHAALGAELQTAQLETTQLQTTQLQTTQLQTTQLQTTQPADLGTQTQAGRLSRQLLDQSLEKGTAFLLASQRPDGDFRYHVNFLTGEKAPEQSLVRQAGALWGLALIHHDKPSAATRAGVLRGIAFFRQHSQQTDRQTRFIRYPGTLEGDSGAVALVALALIDFLRAEPVGQYGALRNELDQYLAFLLTLRRTDQRFHRKYLASSGEGWGQSSPYFDGEILLALVKAARYAGRHDLQQQCLQSAEAMYQAYVQDAVAQRQDADATKGFFQWGSMAFLELYDSQWESTQPYARRTIGLSHWMIDVHGVLQRRRNTAYAYEGLVCAFQLAQQINDLAAADKFRRTIERGLGKLTSWQVGGPIPSDYLQAVAQYDSSCQGGVLGADENPWLRIDTTQHQMHAVILARRYVWK